ncbi:MAG: sulfatase-like hydrolase/transferase [Gammaproteobacteria bacterium]|nr:sulfatase-like hydrolase/transferase [Gammaproteobacteria bacterium]
MIGPISLLVGLNILLVGVLWWLPAGAEPSALPLLALEIPLLVAGLMLLRGKFQRYGIALVACVFIVGILLGFSELGAQWALGRGLDLSADLPLLISVVHLLEGAMGWGLTLFVVLLSALVLLVLAVGLTRGLAWSVQKGRPAVGAGLLLLLGGVWFGQQMLGGGLLGVPLAAQVYNQANAVIAADQDRINFTQTLQEHRKPTAALSRLKGRDVVVAFVESYDAASADTASGIESMADRLKADGLGVATARYVSPISGGQSWLAHATFLTGLTINSQQRYEQFLEWGGHSLITDFQRAGYQTAAVVPAIVGDWPEGTAWGFDAVFDAASIDYAGPRLGWATMPDQFTWHYFSEQVREPAAAPLFTQIALISSHAPWTPVIELTDWSTIGDGKGFSRWADAGPSALSVWSNTETRQRYYSKSIDYALNAAIEWALCDLDDGVLILMGDHAPAPLVDGKRPSRSVPVHIITTDTSLLAEFERQGFEPGVMAADKAIGQFSDLRGLLLEVF